MNFIQLGKIPCPYVAHFHPLVKLVQQALLNNKPKVDDPFVRVIKATKPQQALNPFEQISEQRKKEHQDLSVSNTTDIDCFNNIVQTYVNRRTWMAEQGMITNEQLLDEVKRVNDFFKTMSDHIK